MHQIIDGWQRISGYVSGDAVFSLVAGTSTEGFVYFDDLRLRPKNALMVSNVYNSTTFKLSETFLLLLGVFAHNSKKHPLFA